MKLVDTIKKSGRGARKSAFNCLIVDEGHRLKNMGVWSYPCSGAVIAALFAAKEGRGRWAGS